MRSISVGDRYPPPEKFYAAHAVAVRRPEFIRPPHKEETIQNIFFSPHFHLPGKFNGFPEQLAKFRFAPVARTEPYIY
jgi:hypothetical protein